MVSGGYIAYSYNISPKGKVSPLEPNNLLIHYIDVGQGDAILVQTRSKNLLIDSGPDNKKSINYLKNQGVSKLDYVVATHPHDDHIGSMDKIINNFNVASFYAPKVTNNTDSFMDMVNALDSKGLKIVNAKPLLKLDLGDSVICTIISPISNYYKELNNYSVVIKISYNNTSFLLMGDAETCNEEEMVREGYNLKADVLKIGHHGSTSSTSDALLSEASPKIAIISCGKDNDYGHPENKTLNKLKEKNISIYRTDIDGSITLESDGNKIMKR